MYCLVDFGPGFIMLHSNPKHFVQVVENAIDSVYMKDQEKWRKLMLWYEKRYLNPDSPEKKSLHKYGC